MRNTLLIFLAILLAHSAVRASVTGITYKLVYNPTSCLYNVYMTIASGSTTSIQEQEAYTAQVSIVVPTGTSVGTTIVSNEPKTGSINNNVLTRTTPKTWANSNFDINNSALPGYDVYSFTAALTNAYYPVLNTGDSILLFSVSIATTSCGAGVRLWNNNEIQGSPVTGDPNSTDIGGTDYNNGHDFSSSSVYQAYIGNGPSRVAPPSPTVTLTPTLKPGVSFADTSASTPGSSCASSLTYAWNGPNSFSSTSPSIYVSPLTNGKYGNYTLTVTDTKGCTAVASTMIAVPLPIKLTSFNGIGEKCTALLTWKAFTDVNFDHFNVQYSKDGIEYLTIGAVKQQGNTDGESSYSFSNNQERNRGYYRLMIVDKNGTFNYSQVVPVLTECELNDITIVPNPASTYFDVTGINAGDEVRITNTMGQAVQTKLSTGSSTRIDMNVCAPGIYSVAVIRDHSAIKTASVIKQ
jgi:hypothetical protein